MRLINIYTLELEEYLEPPPYAILSHRWTGAEITYEQYIDPDNRQGPGYNKIREFCSFLRDGIRLANEDSRIAHESPNFDLSREFKHTTLVHAWIDTCCIDKRSSAELSEAINSMWQYYEESAFCVAYLADVPHGSGWRQQFSTSVWFKRGWTLQELLAPSNVYFCDICWHVLGQKTDPYMNSLVSSITRIPKFYIGGLSLDRYESASVAQKMSWASWRSTTRMEDRAYCLFGLFRVNLPLLYGEGAKAFLRLQQEIAAHSEDESIFAWKRHGAEEWSQTGLLARSPLSFENTGDIHHCIRVHRPPYEITKAGIKIQSKLLQTGRSLFLLRLNCVEIRKPPESLWHAGTNTPGKVEASECAILLSRQSDGRFIRCHQPQEFETLPNSRVIEDSTLYLLPQIDEAMHHLGLDEGLVAERITVVSQRCLLSSEETESWYSDTLAREPESDVYSLDGAKVGRKQRR